MRCDALLPEDCKQPWDGTVRNRTRLGSIKETPSGLRPASLITSPFGRGRRLNAGRGQTKFEGRIESFETDFLASRFVLHPSNFTCPLPGLRARPLPEGEVKGDCGKRYFVVDQVLARVAFCLLACALWALVTAADVGTAAEQQDVGERVVDFELPVVGSEEYLSLSDEYEQGAVVVVVLRGYPGYQCPVCSRQVGSLANRAKGLAGQAHRVILVYPGEGTLLKRHAGQFMGSRSLPQPLVLVRDDEMKMVASWGLRWRAHRETAYPATYIIGRNGRIRWKKVSESHAGRSTVEEILKELRKL